MTIKWPSSGHVSGTVTLFILSTLKTIGLNELSVVFNIFHSKIKIGETVTQQKNSGAGHVAMCPPPHPPASYQTSL